MTSNALSRNEFKKYLLANMENVESLMAENGIVPIRKSGRLEYATRKIMSTLGLWENEKFNSVLESLYFDHNSHKLLEHLRHECSQQVMDKRLNEYLDKHGKKLGIEHESLDILHASGDTIAANKLLRAYLNDTAVKNAGRVVKSTGFNTTATVAVIIVSVGTLFTPAAPLAFAALGIIAAGYMGSKWAQYYHQRKMQELVENVRDHEIADIFTHHHYQTRADVPKSSPHITKSSFIFRPISQPNQLPANNEYQPKKLSPKD